MKHGNENGLISRAQWRSVQTKEASIAAALHYVRTAPRGGKPLVQLLRRPEVSMRQLAAADRELAQLCADPAVGQQVEIEVKYEGYLTRQRQQVEKFLRNESKRIPAWLDYSAIPHLRAEAREKLCRVQPVSLGQASRISGISPADISILMVYVEGRNRLSAGGGTPAPAASDAD
jgi:tRNA uridine 5-carboxymethylaminomethyl modification enzyme